MLTELPVKVITLPAGSSSACSRESYLGGALDFEVAFVIVQHSPLVGQATVCNEVTSYALG